MSQFPVSVKAVLLDAERRVVLLKNERGEWELPGGKLEAGEQPPDVVEREVEEELGLRVRCGPILDSWVFEVLPGREVLIVTYAAEAPSFDGIRRSEEHSEIGVFTAEETERLPMPEGYRASIRHGLASAPAPGRMTLRDAREADVPALSELHVRAFGETHGGGPTAALREQQWRAKFASGQLVFCVVLETGSGGLIGFASGELHDGAEAGDFRGELNKIYLLREYQRQGLGRRLLCAAAERFLARGVESMLLFGDAKSPTNGFYEAMRGERLYASNGEFHGGYGWRDLTVLSDVCSGSSAV